MKSFDEQVKRLVSDYEVGDLADEWNNVLVPWMHYLLSDSDFSKTDFLKVFSVIEDHLDGGDSYGIEFELAFLKFIDQAGETLTKNEKFLNAIVDVCMDLSWPAPVFQLLNLESCSDEIFSFVSTQPLLLGGDVVFRSELEDYLNFGEELDFEIPDNPFTLSFIRNARVTSALMENFLSSLEQCIQDFALWADTSKATPAADTLPVLTLLALLDETRVTKDDRLRVLRMLIICSNYDYENQIEPIDMPELSNAELHFLEEQSKEFWLGPHALTFIKRVHYQHSDNSPRVGRFVKPS